MKRLASRKTVRFVCASGILAAVYMLSLPLVQLLQMNGWMDGLGWVDVEIYSPLVWAYRQSPMLGSFLDWYSTLLSGPPAVAPLFRTHGGVI